jgi:hypothetical protein
VRVLPGAKRLPRPVLAGVAIVPVAFAGFMLPSAANLETDRIAAALMAKDGGTEPRIAPGASVARLAEPELAIRECWDECQRFLFTGVVRSYVTGTLDALHRSSALTRHAMVPLAQGCDNALLKATYADRAEIGDRHPPPLLWKKLPALAAQGLCFRSDPVRDLQADYVLVETLGLADPERTRTGFDWRPHPFEPIRRREVYQRQGGRLVRILRRTELRYSHLRVPLTVTPPFTFDTHSRGSWGRSGLSTRGAEPPAAMARWATNDVTVRGL